MSKVKAPLSILDKIYNAYENSMDKMLIHTGTIGWLMSSAAQIFAIIINDKIPKEQKMFLIPQEFMDACVNILSFYLVTRSFTGVADKLVKTGKWIPNSLKRALIKGGFEKKIGNFNFDISKIKLTSKPKATYNWFKGGVGVFATTIGTVISCNIITPILRNIYASHRQQKNIAKMNNPNPALQNPQNNRDRAKAVIHKAYMQTFMNKGNLKV